MNLDSLSFTLSQISYLVANLSKKNFKASAQEISHLIGLHGLEADRHLLRCLLSHLDLSSEGLKNSSKDFCQIQLLSQECAAHLAKPALASNLVFAFDYPFFHQKTLKASNQLLPVFSKTLKLTPVQEVVIGLALLHSSNPDLSAVAAQFVKQKLPELIRAYINSESGCTSLQDGGLHDTTPEVLHLILTNIIFGSSEQFGVTVEVKEVFLKYLRRDFPRELVPVILAPLLYPSFLDLPMEKLNHDPSSMANPPYETNLAELVMEIGYKFCSSLESCKSHLISFVHEITPVKVACVLSVMIRTHSGNDNSFWSGSTDPNVAKDKQNDPNNPTTWIVDIFVQAIKELVPNLNWNEVIIELDSPTFIVKDRQGLTILVTALRIGLNAAYHPERFPVENFYRPWKHVDGQISLITQILKNPDVFCFTDYPHHSVNVEILKSPPDNDNKEIFTWRSLDLVETVICMAERGGIYFTQVHEVLKLPIQHCPDVLVLGLLQLNTPITVVRSEILSKLMPIFFGNHPNAGIILHHAWHTQGLQVRQIIMHSMSEWYLRGDSTDQTRLTRILDVSQDLKALSLLLNANSFPFVIDLACLASRREYLKLDKWLNDKIREHGEAFVSACVKFLQRRCPQIIGNIGKEETLPKSAQLPPETLTTMIVCLQACTGNVQQELSDAILNMVANCNILLSKPRQPPPGVIRANRPLDPVFGPFAPPVDSLNNLGTTLAGLTLGGPPSSSAFSVQGPLGALVSTPGSPSRLMNPSQSPGPPFPLGLPLGAPGGPPPPISSAISSVNLRLAPQQADKGRTIGEIQTLFPDMQGTISKEIEDEANGYFQRIYNHPPHPTLSIDEVLDMLKSFQDSPKQREREVFGCMLRNLFEEYKFFPQYPEKELHITAQLFGGIIERGLVTNYMTLGLALRFVLDALRKTNGSKMYYFGIAALDRFKSKLKDYQKYCEHVMTIPHFKDFPPHLIEYMEYGIQGIEPPNRPQGSILPMISSVTTTGVYKTITATTITTTTTMSGLTVSKPTNTASVITPRPSIANATNIDTLLVATEKEDKMTAPPESMQDKVAFIFNNLSQLNLQTKCDELRDIVTEEYWPWMSQYLVMKRASIELNFHVLYSNFLDVLKVPELNKMVLRETYRNIRVLLRSDKSSANFSDRSLLKNLGHWLGMLTLGRNKPILMIDLDVKSLLVEAYSKGQQELLFIVPFVAKVLESCSKSKVFKPPNPWTMAVMNVLSELHQETDLKLNLKFEIEVLCKNLSIDIRDLNPGVYLKNSENVKTLEHQLSVPKSKNEMSNALVPLSQNQLQTVNAQAVAQVNQQLTRTPQKTVSSVNLAGDELINSLSSAATAGPPPTSTAVVAVPNAPPPPPPQQAPVPPPPPSVLTPTNAIAAEPRFNYFQLNISGTFNPSNPVINPSVAQFVSVNDSLPLFQAHPHLKLLVWLAVEQTIKEWLIAVVERTVKIVVTSTERNIRRDFALDSDETKVRAAAHHMVRNLSAGYALLSCKDQLLITLNNNLKVAFTKPLREYPNVASEIEKTSNQVAHDNVELACAYIQKTASEKAVIEIDKLLMPEYENRKIARREGRRYCDAAFLSYHMENLPERLKLSSNPIQEMQLYELFTRFIPGFMPLSERDANLMLQKSVNDQMSVVPSFPTSTAQLQPYGGADEISQLFDKLILELEHFIQMIISSGNAAAACYITAIQHLLEYVQATRRSRDSLTAMTLIQKAVDGLLDGPNQTIDHDLTIRYRELHLGALKILQDGRLFGTQWVNKNVTRYLMDCREECRYNLEAVDLLIRSHLVNMQQYDLHIAQSMDNGHNGLAMAFGMQLVQHFLIDDRNSNLVTENDLFNVVEILCRIVNHARQPPEGLSQLMDMLRITHENNFLDRAPGGPTAQIQSGILQVRTRGDAEDPPGLVEKTEYLLREWVNMNNSGKDPSKAFGVFVHQMNLHGILKTDDLITRFFRISTQLVVEICYRSLPDASVIALRTKIFNTIDAFVKLIALLVKHSGDSAGSNTKINLLNKVLGIVAGVLLQDHESRKLEFQQLPYHRIFVMLFLELNSPEPILEAINFQVLSAFCHVLHILRPSKSSGFSYAWLELVSHRIFLGRMLAYPQQKGWGMYAQLLIDLFRYLAPFLRNAELAKPVTILYKGTLRVLLVLLHDFPEFLCDYHYGFCDVIPPNCIQMRNLILSAFPRTMRLPDPFTPNLKVDMLAEIAQAPRVCTNFASIIQPSNFKKDLDSYLKARSPVTFLSDLRSNLQVSNEPGMRYNISLMNALVLYVGSQAISHIRNKGLSVNNSTIAHSAHMDIFQNLAVDLDTEGRYLFLNAIANQLRFPNSHTHYFSCTLLYLFAEANTEAIQEQITRVLLERLIVNRPHPWGLLITFIELIKNPTYKFWNHEFVHCAPEIEKLFESVARSCMVSKQALSGTNNTSENDMPEI